MSSFNIQGAVAFVTGTNKPNGIGRAIVDELLKRGATKVYATARKGEQLNDLVKRSEGRVEAVALDVTDSAATGALGKKFPEVNLIVNNAGLFAGSGALSGPELAKKEMDVNYFGPLHIVQSFQPVFVGHKGQRDTAVVNINSIASLISFPLGGTYSASKAASHSLTQSQRRDLPDSLVVGVYPGPIDTDMVKDIPMDKATPGSVAVEVAEALEQGTEDVFPDPMSAQLFEGWKADAKAMENNMTAQSREGASASE